LVADGLHTSLGRKKKDRMKRLQSQGEKRDFFTRGNCAKVFRSLSGANKISKKKEKLAGRGKTKIGNPRGEAGPKFSARKREKGETISQRGGRWPDEIVAASAKRGRSECDNWGRKARDALILEKRDALSGGGRCLLSMGGRLSREKKSLEWHSRKSWRQREEGIMGDFARRTGV